MRLWGGESDTGCCSVADVDDARRVAQQLGIDHLVFNFTDDFDAHVVSRTSTRTPRAARRTRASSATGTSSSTGSASAPTCWASTPSPPATTPASCTVGGRPLRRSVAPTPTRTRATSCTCCRQRELARTLFPVGHLTKAEVRDAGRRARPAHGGQARQPGRVLHHPHRRAHARSSATASRSARAQSSTSTGTQLGEVDAVELVTVGQRRGIGLPGGGPKRYVVDVDVRRGASWWSATTSTCSTTRVRVDGDRRGSTSRSTGDVLVQCSAHGAARRGDDRRRRRRAGTQPQRRVAPGQSVVLYDPTDRCVLGGGIATRRPDRDRHRVGQPTGQRSAAAASAGRPGGSARPAPTARGARCRVGLARVGASTTVVGFAQRDLDGVAGGRAGEVGRLGVGQRQSDRRQMSARGNIDRLGQHQLVVHDHAGRHQHQPRRDRRGTGGRGTNRAATAHDRDGAPSHPLRARRAAAGPTTRGSAQHAPRHDRRQQERRPAGAAGSDARRRTPSPGRSTGRTRPPPTNGAHQRPSARRTRRTPAPAPSIAAMTATTTPPARRCGRPSDRRVDGHDEGHAPTRPRRPTRTTVAGQLHRRGCGRQGLARSTDPPGTRDRQPHERVRAHNAGQRRERSCPAVCTARQDLSIAGVHVPASSGSGSFARHRACVTR